jgi:hypothetical protein
LPVRYIWLQHPMPGPRPWRTPHPKIDIWTVM